MQACIPLPRINSPLQQHTQTSESFSDVFACCSIWTAMLGLMQFVTYSIATHGDAVTCPALPAFLPALASCCLQSKLLLDKQLVAQQSVNASASKAEMWIRDGDRRCPSAYHYYSCNTSQYILCVGMCRSAQILLLTHQHQLCLLSALRSQRMVLHPSHTGLHRQVHLPIPKSVLMTRPAALLLTLGV